MWPVKFHITRFTYLLSTEPATIMEANKNAPSYCETLLYLHEYLNTLNTVMNKVLSKPADGVDLVHMDLALAENKHVYTETQ